MDYEKLIAIYEKGNQFGRLVAMELVAIKDGEVSYQMTINDTHLATPFAAHGGVVASIVDGALGVAALSSVSKYNKVVSTIEFKINYLLPALKGDLIKATGTVIKSGKSLLVVECKVVNQKNECIATATGTFNTYPAEKVFKVV